MKTIPLTQGYVALVDDEDFERVSAFKWCAMVNKRTVYAMRSVGIPGKPRTAMLMHRFILGCAEDVDHRNCNGLDNQRGNLRPATKPQNASNRRKVPGKSSRFKGVSWYSGRRKWHVRITVNGKVIHLGYFTEEYDAAQAYNFAAEEHFGEYAVFNIPIPSM